MRTAYLVLQGEVVDYFLPNGSEGVAIFTPLPLINLFLYSTFSP
jgi:hypothetical protein